MKSKQKLWDSPNTKTLDQAIKEISSERGDFVEFMICMRTVNQNFKIGNVIISQCLVKFRSKEEAELSLIKFREVFGDLYYFWVL